MIQLGIHRVVRAKDRQKERKGEGAGVRKRGNLRYRGGGGGRALEISGKNRKKRLSEKGIEIKNGREERERE